MAAAKAPSWADRSKDRYFTSPICRSSFPLSATSAASRFVKLAASA
jgi:hypothetical protein